MSRKRQSVVMQTAGSAAGQRRSLMLASGGLLPQRRRNPDQNRSATRSGAGHDPLLVALIEHDAKSTRKRPSAGL
jgi:hypothetical protein